MDTYDENLSHNKFLHILRNDFKVVFNEAVSNQYIICIPKSEVIIGLTFGEILDHILIPSEKEPEKTNSFYTKNGVEIVIANGKLILKEDNTKFLNILFEETFYEGKFKKYKVICIDGYISNLFKEKLPSNYLDWQILKNLRSGSDFKQQLHLLSENNSSYLSEIDCFIRQFVTSSSKPEELRKEVHNLINKCIKAFNDSNQVIPDFQINVLSLCIESYILHKLHDILFQAVSSCSAVDDEHFNRTLHSIKDFNTPNFNNTFIHMNMILSAKYELASINNFKSPVGKLQSIRKAIQSFKILNTKSLTSDELLPLLVYCIIKCNITNWFANLNFIKMFTYNLVSNCEYNYILTSLEAALIFINSGGVEKQDFINLIKEICKTSQEEIIFELDKFNPKSQKCISETQIILYEYIRKKNVEKVKNMFERKERKSITKSFDLDSQMCHPLCTCEDCKLLVREYSYHSVSLISPDMQDENMSTPLHISAWYGSENVVEYLISLGVDCNARNIAGMTALHFAAYKGHQSVVLLLLYFNSDVNCTDGEGNTALHLACKAGHDNCVKALIFYSESIGNFESFNMKNFFGDTPLHLASHWGYSSIVQFLINQPKISKSLLLKNLNNHTPIDCAHNEIIQSILLESKSGEFEGPTDLILLNFEPKQNFKYNSEINSEKDEIKVADESQKLRKAFRAVKVGDTKLACYYLEINNNNNESLSVPYSDQCHPLCQCINCSSTYLEVKIMRDYSLINSLVDGVGLLHMAVLTNNLDLCFILLKNGANPNLQTKKDNQTSLHLSAIQENLEIMKCLISFSANFDCTDIYGNTPLHLCCTRGWKDGVLFLIKCGANVSVNNKNDISPTEEAEKRGYIDIVKALIRKL